MGKDRFEDLDFIDFNDSRRQEGTVIADMLSQCIATGNGSSSP